MNIISNFSQILWTVLYFLLIGLGFYFSFKTNFFQIRKFGFMLKSTLGKIFEGRKNSDKGSFTPWQAVSTALASTIGTGNIVGVATAITTGGPGAVFWMWAMAFLGMMIKFSEIVLALRFRERNINNEWSGGAIYYIKNGLKNNFLAIFFACATIANTLLSGNILQINSVVGVVNNYGIPKIFVAIFMMAIVGFAVIGGMKSIGRITESIVPFMSVLYVVGSVFAICVNINKIPQAFCDIFTEAFKLKSFGGGVLGYGLFYALHYGIARGTASSEAGIGSAPIAHAASSLTEPVEQGLYGILEVLVSSFVICTMTAIVILTGGVYDKNIYSSAITKYGIENIDLPQGVSLTASSFASAMDSNIANLFITLCILFFGLSTIIGWFYYGSKAYEFISQGKFIIIYKCVFILAIILGAFASVNTVWEFADIANGLMALPNLIALVFLSPIIFQELKIYFNKDNKNKKKD